MIAHGFDKTNISKTQNINEYIFKFSFQLIEGDDDESDEDVDEEEGEHDEEHDVENGLTSYNNLVKAQQG